VCSSFSVIPELEEVFTLLAPLPGLETLISPHGIEEKKKGSLSATGLTNDAKNVVLLL
jgi:hypothetical protein